jgi:transposase-like protein
LNEIKERQMNTGIKRTCKDYTLAFKLAVVEQVERGELTYLEAQDRYGIQGSSTVLTWLRKHGHMDWYNLSSSDLKGTMMAKKLDLPLSPEQLIKALEVELADAKLKAQLFEAMLNVIQNEYGVKLPKKPLRASLPKKKLFE